MKNISLILSCALAVLLTACATNSRSHSAGSHHSSGPSAHSGTNCCHACIVLCCDSHGGKGSSSAPPVISFFSGGGASPFIQMMQEPQDVLVRLGDPAQLKVAVAGPDVTYQWRYRGTVLSNQTNATLSFPAVATNQLGEYDCLISTEIETRHTRIATLAGYFDTGPGITLIAYPPTTPPGQNTGVCPFPSVGKLRFPAGETTFVRKTSSLPPDQYKATDIQRTDTKIFYQGNIYYNRGCGVTPVQVATGMPFWVIEPE